MSRGHLNQVDAMPLVWVQASDLLPFFCVSMPEKEDHVGDDLSCKKPPVSTVTEEEKPMPAPTPRRSVLTP